jgi:hypothetical protein
MKPLKLMLVLFAALLLSACGPKSKIEGTYSPGPHGTVSYTFKSNGKMIMSVMGIETEMEYELKGKDIRVFPLGRGGSSMVMTLLEDGSIQEGGLIFSKQTVGRDAQPEVRDISTGGSPAGVGTANPTSPVVRQGTVQTFRRDSNGQLTNLGTDTNSSGSGQARPGNVEVKRMVLNNLRQLSAAADQFYLENGVSTASYEQLVGPNKYVREVRSADGEDYRTLVFKQGQELLVTTRNGLTIRYAP